MIPIRCLILRYRKCFFCTMGSNVPLSGTMVLYLPKLQIGRKRKNMERATSMLRRISCRKSRAYANPPFSLLAKVLTKIAYEGGRVVICTPDWGCSGEHAYWRRMLDRMTVGRVQLPDGPIYVPEDSDTAMQAPEWASFLSIVGGSLNPVPLCDVDQVLLK